MYWWRSELFDKFWIIIQHLLPLRDGRLVAALYSPGDSIIFGGGLRSLIASIFSVKYSVLSSSTTAHAQTKDHYEPMFHAIAAT